MRNLITFADTINITTDMKKISYILSAFAAMMLASCDLDVDSVMPGAQMVADYGFGGSVQFKVWASGPWTASIGGDEKFKIKMEPMNGPEGEIEVKLEIPENDTVEDRMSYIQFTCGESSVSTPVYQYAAHMYYQDEEAFLAKKMKDGNWWTVQNISYIPKGKNISLPDFSKNTGIWYPCTTTVAADGTVSVDYTISYDAISRQGYFYSYEVVNAAGEEDSQSICAKGWHIPTEAEWENLITSYKGNPADGIDVKVLNDDNFNFYPLQYVQNGSKYSDEVLNFNGEESFRKLASTGYYFTSAPIEDGDFTAAAISNTETGTTLKLTKTSSTNGINLRCVRDLVPPEE